MSSFIVTVPLLQGSYQAINCDKWSQAMNEVLIKGLLSSEACTHSCALVRGSSLASITRPSQSRIVSCRSQNIQMTLDCLTDNPSTSALCVDEIGSHCYQGRLGARFTPRGAAAARVEGSAGLGTCFGSGFWN